MSTIDYPAEMRSALSGFDIAVAQIEERTYPGERWLIAYVPGEQLTLAQSLAGQIELNLNQSLPKNSAPFAVTFRPLHTDENKDAGGEPEGGRLSKADVTRLIQLLEARSRTSDALPSLSYVEDPRASLAAVAASRHHLVYGRRGVGKTALLLEAKRIAENAGHITSWVNAHILRELDAEHAFVVIAETMLDTILKNAGSSRSAAITRLESERTVLENCYHSSGSAIIARVPKINAALRNVLRQDLMRLYLFVDDFYLLPPGVQPQLLDYVAGILRDCDAWIKIASIERMTRPYEPSRKIGLEIPHDASKIDLDVTLEDPTAAQRFLESVLTHYTSAAGIRQPSSIAKVEALGRLVIASGGVPRDYLNLFAASIVAARQGRPQAREIGREDVAKAANEAARSKKKDLDQDVASETSGRLLSALERVSNAVKKGGYTYFKVDMAEKSHPGYTLLGQLVDMRFMHLVQVGLSDQHRPGRKYEAYILDLSEYADVRLQRKLEILDLEYGNWVRRLTGKDRTKAKLNGTQLRDLLRRSPLIHVDEVLLGED